MPEQPIAIADISDPDLIRVKLLASGRDVHAPMSAVTAASIHAAPTKTTPVNADEFGYWDSVGLQAVKTTWTNIKATIWTALGALINGGTGKTTPVDADMFAIADSAASNATKKLTWANLKATFVATINTWSAVQTFSAIPVLSGGAISFPATQVPSAGANDLDDYEEGSFTPVIAGTTAAGVGTYSTQSGTYTKIGNRVLFEIDITWSAHTGTGNMILTGLPFTAGAGTTCALYWESMTYAATPTAVIGNGSTTITFRNNASGGGATALAMDTAARFVISGCYRV